MKPKFRFSTKSIKLKMPTLICSIDLIETHKAIFQESFSAASAELNPLPSNFRPNTPTVSPPKPKLELFRPRLCLFKPVVNGEYYLHYIFLRVNSHQTVLEPKILIKKIFPNNLIPERQKNICMLLVSNPGLLRNKHS